MKWSFNKLGIAVLCVSSLSLSLANSANRVYYLEHAKYCKPQTNTNFYIKAGSFSYKSNALRYQKLLQAATSYPVQVSHKNKFYVVLVGPITSALKVKETAISLLKLSSQTLKKTKKNKNSIQLTKTVHQNSTLKQPNDNWSPSKATSFFTRALNSDANWFLMVGAGAEFPTSHRNVFINNGSLFPAPYDRDIYTIKQSTSGLVNVMGGRRWERKSTWIPAISLGVFYQHSFLNPIRGTVTQYSLPSYTNYNYHWNLSSDIVLASAKVNMYSRNCFSPYIMSGIGGAFNQSSYGESALSGVTPRISPDFSGNTSQFAYNVGAGIDFQAFNHWIISVGYLYQSLGHLSGKGKGRWSETSFGLGTYGLNEILVHVSYLFDR